VLSRQVAELSSVPGAFHHPQKTRLLERLVELAPRGLVRAFLCNSGTEAIEAALKLARASTGRSKIVAAKRGFHGRSFGAMSVTFSPQQHALFAPVVPDVDFIAYNKTESLDEVFWRIYAGVEYIEKTHLKPHWPDAETIWKYVCYVNAVLDAQETRLPRYLSKNNNNILRLDSIRLAFPRALILVPFREPLAHAQSLLRQHRRFIQMQAQEGFVRSYMTWLAHHEFGCDHRPFRFGDDGPFLPSSRTTDTLDYWLEIWCETYGWLERSAPEDAVFVCYEDLCNRAEVWSRLAGLAGISADLHEDQPFQASSGDVEAAYDFALAEQTSVIYSRLAERARIALR